MNHTPSGTCMHILRPTTFIGHSFIHVFRMKMPATHKNTFKQCPDNLHFFALSLLFHCIFKQSHTRTTTAVRVTCICLTIFIALIGLGIFFISFIHVATHLGVNVCVFSCMPFVYEQCNQSSRKKHELYEGGMNSVIKRSGNFLRNIV